MGLFNPQSREEQAHYGYHENARFRSVFKIFSLELSSAVLRTLLSAILIAIFSIVNFKLHIPNSILTSALERAIIVAYTTVANATIGGVYAKNNEKSE